jgi:hypothetical protein
MTTADPAITIDQMAQLISLLRGADSVELKATVPDNAIRSAITALDMDALDAQIRQVFFFDTPELALQQAGVVVRARRVQRRGEDSVIKLRPVVPNELPDELRASPALVVEVDAMHGGYVCSATLKRRIVKPLVRNVVAGEVPIRKLFSKEQRAFYKEHAPEGLALDDLRVMGPVFVLKVPFGADDYRRKVVAEMWLYPNGTRLLELSTKCAPADAFDVAQQMIEFLDGRGVVRDKDPQTKTKTALQFFAQELQAPDTPSA